MLRASILVICVLLAQVFTQDPVSPEDCRTLYRPGTSPEKYEQIDGDDWREMVCNDDLIWDQSVCQCNYDDSLKTASNCNSRAVLSEDPSAFEMRNGQGFRLTNCRNEYGADGLIWDNDKCTCVWDPEGPSAVIPDIKKILALIPAKCLLMSNITFDDEVMDYRGSYLDIVNRASINFNTGNLRNAVNSYGCFSDAWIGIPYFSGNSLGATFRIKFKFSVCENDVRNQDFVTLIGQEAFPMDDNVPEPTMNFGYRAIDSAFRVTMATGGEIDMASDVCRARIIRFALNDVDIRYERSILQVIINGEMCMMSQRFSGGVTETFSELTLGEDGFCGCFDEFSITRGCESMEG